MRIRQSFLIAAMACLGWAGTSHAATTWAILVGVSKYQSPLINSLNFPASDATNIGEALVNPQLGNIPSDHVHVLTNTYATKANIEKQLDNLKHEVKPGDQIVIFLAGHGVAKGVGTEAKSYLLPTDVRGLTTAALDESAVDLKKFSQQLGQLPASQFTIFVDACREDPTRGRGVMVNTRSDVLTRDVQVIPEQTDDATSPVSSVTFYACDVGQRAFEDPTYQHGVFTYWILNGISKAATVPRKINGVDGAIDMRVLSDFVSTNVQDWAKKTSASGDFEVDQNPQLVAYTSQPVVLMHVKRASATGDQAPDPGPSKLMVTASPDNAQVSVDGKKVGVGTADAQLAQPGEHTITAEAPGYAPKTQTVKVVNGYSQQVALNLEPAARGVQTAPVASPADDFYQKALNAETHQQWEEAEQGYNLVIQGDVKYGTAYEHLASLQLRAGRNKDAISTLSGMMGQLPPTAHTYSSLSEAYATFAAKGPGDDNGGLIAPGNAFPVPATQLDAGPLALRTAQQAVNLAPASAEAQRALGLALIATDKGGQNQRTALAAFGQAAIRDDKDAANQYGMGYGLRYFALFLKPNVQPNQVQRAIPYLQQAIALRPDYYEAHHELATCYHLLGNTDAAIKEYNIAAANRGGASDSDEFAGNDVALSGLHKEKADKSTGEKKQQEQAASDGYMDEAKDTAKHKNLERVMQFLAGGGVGGRLINFLPSQYGQQLGRASQALALINDPGTAIKNRGQDEIKKRTHGLGGLGDLLGG